MQKAAACSLRARCLSSATTALTLTTLEGRGSLMGLLIILLVVMGGVNSDVT